ncbi:MAG: 2-C-methyl-D-erythritol 2,4-cyclodiphosphate synthase [Oscillospiraceae bacterium]|nr:2-C-methyl-D-erythritol 2,4-cyclodiphosphate synthase [Oscillospiraceae bacterium]
MMNKDISELMPASKSAELILACGGRSTRMGGENKLLSLISGKPCIYRACEPFCDFPEIKRIIISAPTELFDTYKTALSGIEKPILFVSSGETRQQSVTNAVKAATEDIIMIHDGARPLVSHDEIKASLDDAFEYGSSIISTPMTETIRFSDGEKSYSPDRSKYYLVKTPQSFSRKLYLYALESSTGDYTDDAQLLDSVGITPHLTMGSRNNIKITVSEDLKMAEGLLGSGNVRIGHGYDVHKLVPDRKLILGGVEIPYDLGLLGHSDADVLTHALMDSLLGAAALGDIGKLFPDTDDKYKGANSIELLKEVCRVLKDNGYQIVNTDITVIAQKPKLAPYILTMREVLANAMDIDIGCVSAKATTEEGLGFTGTGEGISAHAVSLIRG